MPSFSLVADFGRLRSLIRSRLTRHLVHELKQVQSEEIHAATATSEARAEELQSILERSRRGWQDESAAKDQALARLQVRRTRGVGVGVCE